MQQHYDVIVVGSGIVGMTFALLLAKNTALKIALLDSKPKDSPNRTLEYDFRVSAINLFAKKKFAECGVWPLIQAKRVSSFTDMSVWDEAGRGEIHFDSASLNENELGFIIEDSVMRESLFEQMRTCPNIHYHCPVALLTQKTTQDGVMLTSDQGVWQGSLLVGADGAHSWVRNAVGIELKTRDYGHTALVATVQTELPHAQRARQVFLSQGPLAFLPLNEPHYSSVVWSSVPDYAAYLLTLADADFKTELRDRFAKKLGDILTVSKRYTFPLHMRHAKDYVRDRVALIGDAAHTLHPLAGLGVNLGIKDAQVLADVMSEAYKNGRQFFSFHTLRRFERERKGDTVLMLGMVGALQQLFASEKKSVQWARTRGLRLTNQLSLIKKILANYAMGNY